MFLPLLKGKEPAKAFFWFEFAKLYSGNKHEYRDTCELCARLLSVDALVYFVFSPSF